MEGADPKVVGPFLASRLEDAAWLECRLERISGGWSNLTFRVTSAAGTVVLRRPPLGELAEP